MDRRIIIIINRWHQYRLLPHPMRLSPANRRTPAHPSYRSAKTERYIRASGAVSLSRQSTTPPPHLPPSTSLPSCSQQHALPKLYHPAPFHLTMHLPLLPFRRPLPCRYPVGGIRACVCVPVLVFVRVLVCVRVCVFALFVFNPAAPDGATASVTEAPKSQRRDYNENCGILKH